MALYDTSALIKTLRSENIDPIEELKGKSILDLTMYEAGNTIWKLYYQRKDINKEEKNLMIKILSKLDTIMKIISIKRRKDLSFEEVLKVAGSKGLTFYDASYLYVAKNTGNTLITLDNGLKDKYNQLK